MLTLQVHTVVWVVVRAVAKVRLALPAAPPVYLQCEATSMLMGHEAAKIRLRYTQLCLALPATAQLFLLLTILCPRGLVKTKTNKIFQKPRTPRAIFAN